MLRQISRAAREVVLKAPAIRYKAWYWIDSSALLAAFSAVLKPHPACKNQVELAKVTWGQRTAVYIRRRCARVIPQVEPAIEQRAAVISAALTRQCSICLMPVRCWSSWTLTAGYMICLLCPSNPYQPNNILNSVSTVLVVLWAFRVWTRDTSLDTSLEPLAEPNFIS